VKTVNVLGLRKALNLMACLGFLGLGGLSYSQNQAVMDGDAMPVSMPAPPQAIPITDSHPSAPATTVDPSVMNLAPAPTSNPQQEIVQLSAHSGFTPKAPRVGDTVVYSIEVTWHDTRVPVLVLAPDSVDFTGLHLVDQSTRHEKSASNAGVENLTVFSYILVAENPGPAKAAALKVRYTTGMSGHEEAVYAQGSHLEILPARFAFIHSAWFFAILASLTAALGAFAFWSVWKTRSRLKAGNRDKDHRDPKLTLIDEVKSVKARIGHGDSRDILLDMERLCLNHLSALSASKTATLTETTPKRFDLLLNHWIETHGEDHDRIADWERLRELFRLAHYAGGHKEPHELQDAWRALKRCLEVPDEN
jgi:hypothetical protein